MNASQELTNPHAAPAKESADWPLSSFSARDWAEAFCERNPSVDFGTAMAWFSNALMRGFDEHAATTIDQVAEFHAAFDVHNGAFPGDTPESTADLRFRLIEEELTELRDAWAQHDMVEVLDALTDLQYVLDGAYLAFGMAPFKDRAFAEVHRSNMTKFGSDGKPVIRSDGKVTKGPNYEPPRLAPLFAGRSPWPAKGAI